MVIEESILVSADPDKVWKIFTDLTCWAGWNTVTTRAACRTGRLEEGIRFTFSIRPFSVPITVKPKIVEIVPGEKVVWSGSKFGIFSRHEFLFQQVANGVLVTSRETFRGVPILLARRTFPKKTIRQLTIEMLQDLKKAAEAVSGPAG
jgi:hypothetical protein